MKKFTLRRCTSEIQETNFEIWYSTILCDTPLCIIGGDGDAISGCDDHSCQRCGYLVELLNGRNVVTNCR